MTPEEILSAFPLTEDVKSELAKGRYWRAKEILRGRLQNPPFVPGLCEQLGVVLLAMRDDLQAGKYLFFSGARRGEYEAAIAIFLERHGRKGWRALLRSVPGSARGHSIEKLPEPVIDVLVALGYSRNALQTEIRKAGQRPGESLGSFAWTVGCAIVLLIVAAVFCLGLMRLFGLIFG